MKACFIGHRNVEATDKLIAKITEQVERLINDGVDTFLFGSRSRFDDLCHWVVSNLQEKYPDIKRLAYSCRSEAPIMKEEKEKTEKAWSKLFGREIHVVDYDGEVEHKTKYTSGKASYVERNYAMIDDSDVCIFYYDPQYLPPRRKYGRKYLSDYQPKSGTKLAYDYAESKKKKIINLFN